LADDLPTVLHDHYKDTFALIRERERQRDKFFWSLIAVITALFLALQYPSFLPKTVEFSSTGAKLSVQVPAAVVISALWATLLMAALPYCSYTVLIDRQYTYLHLLEDQISKHFGDEKVYRREGQMYNENYPIVSWWAWFLYTLVFPALAIVCVVALQVNQFKTEGAPRTFMLFNLIVGACVVATFVLYKFWPLLTCRRERPQE
jgi:hypothetical protein